MSLSDLEGPVKKNLPQTKGFFQADHGAGLDRRAEPLRDDERSSSRGSLVGRQVGLRTRSSRCTCHPYRRCCRPVAPTQAPAEAVVQQEHRNAGCVWLRGVHLPPSSAKGDEVAEGEQAQRGRLGHDANGEVDGTCVNEGNPGPKLVRIPRDRVDALKSELADAIRKEIREEELVPRRKRLRQTVKNHLELVINENPCRYDDRGEVRAVETDDFKVICGVDRRVDEGGMINAQSVLAEIGDGVFEPAVALRDIVPRNRQDGGLYFRGNTSLTCNE